MQQPRQFDQFVRATAVCVNLALDCVEGDIRSELQKADGEAAELLVRLLEKLKTRRVTDEMVTPSAQA